MWINKAVRTKNGKLYFLLFAWLQISYSGKKWAAFADPCWSNVRYTGNSTIFESSNIYMETLRMPVICDALIGLTA